MEQPNNLENKPVSDWTDEEMESYLDRSASAEHVLNDERAEFLAKNYTGLIDILNAVMYDLNTKDNKEKLNVLGINEAIVRIKRMGRLSKLRIEEFNQTTQSE